MTSIINRAVYGAAVGSLSLGVVSAGCALLDRRSKLVIMRQFKADATIGAVAGGLIALLGSMLNKGAVIGGTMSLLPLVSSRYHSPTIYFQRELFSTPVMVTAGALIGSVIYRVLAAMRVVR